MVALVRPFQMTVSTLLLIRMVTCCQHSRAVPTVRRAPPAVTAGMITLGEDGLAKVKQGTTTAEELLRVVTEVREMRSLCGGCGCAVGVDFLACPECGKRLGGGCPHCGRALQPGWNYCPYCAKSTVETAKRPPNQGGLRFPLRPEPIFLREAQPSARSNLTMTESGEPGL